MGITYEVRTFLDNKSTNRTYIHLMIKEKFNKTIQYSKLF